MFYLAKVMTAHVRRIARAVGSFKQNAGCAALTRVTFVGNQWNTCATTSNKMRTSSDTNWFDSKSSV